MQTMNDSNEAQPMDPPNMRGSVLQNYLSSGLQMEVSHLVRMLQSTRRLRGCKRRRRQHGGSVRGRARNKDLDCTFGIHNIQRDCWGVDGGPPVFDKARFESPF